jgi:hypothetical protein
MALPEAYDIRKGGSPMAETVTDPSRSPCQPDALRPEHAGETEAAVMNNAIRQGR